MLPAPPEHAQVTDVEVPEVEAEATASQLQSGDILDGDTMNVTKVSEVDAAGIAAMEELEERLAPVPEAVEPFLSLENGKEVHKSSIVRQCFSSFGVLKASDRLFRVRGCKRKSTAAQSLLGMIQCWRSSTLSASLH